MSTRKPLGADAQEYGSGAMYGGGGGTPGGGGGGRMGGGGGGAKGAATLRLPRPVRSQERKTSCELRDGSKALQSASFTESSPSSISFIDCTV